MRPRERWSSIFLSSMLRIRQQVMITESKPIVLLTPFPGSLGNTTSLAAETVSQACFVRVEFSQVYASRQDMKRTPRLALRSHSPWQGVTLTK